MKKLIVSLLLSTIIFSNSVLRAENLKYLIKQVEKRNIGVKISNLLTEQSYIDQKNALNNLIPNINFTAARSHKTLKDSYQKSNPFAFDTTLTYSLKLVQSYPGLGRIPWIKRKIAKLQTKVKKLELSKAKIAATRKIIEIYFSLVKERELAEVDNKNIYLAEKLLEVAKLNEEVGLILKNDVLRIEVEEYNYKSSKATAKKNFANLKTDLLNQLDLTNSVSSITPILPESLRFPTEKLSFEKLYKILEKNDQDIAVAKTDIRILSQTIRMSKSAHLPTLSVESALNHGAKLGPITGTEDVTTTFILTTPVYDGGEIENGIRKAKKTKEIAELNLRNILNIKRTKLKKAIADYNEALVRIAFAEKTVEQSFENMKIVFSRYKEGAASIVELVDAQSIVTNSAKSAIRAYYDERKRLAEVYLQTQQREKLYTLAKGSTKINLDFLFKALGLSDVK